ncbi:MAG TPA: ATP-binding protein, partial [Steroidobacteraceae bacterium]|nr:ATP-binding protein [Steroidobacteraceae bacterium]
AISPVTLYTEVLLDNEPDLGERTRDYLRIIQRAVGDVAETVARMREFYRERDAQSFFLPVQLNRIVEQVMDLTRARWSDMAQRKGTLIEVKTELAADVPDVLGIESELREALTNLVINAIDAMPSGGTLTVRTSAMTGSLRRGGASEPVQSVLEVIDTGVGMDDATRRRCLEPFFTTKGEQGTGLGLAMVYGTIQRHGAEMEIESAPGRGTTVRLRFTPPRMEVPVARVAANTMARPQKLRILLIDDDPVLLKSLRDVLEVDGHTVTSANGGQAGVDAFVAVRGTANEFSVVITDLGMPQMDGRRVAAAIKAASAATPVILLTGWGQRLIAESDVPPHVDRVLSKPPKLTALRAALAELTFNSGRG